jgi:hypothetical protein
MDKYLTGGADMTKSKDTAQKKESFSKQIKKLESLLTSDPQDQEKREILEKIISLHAEEIKNEKQTRFVPIVLNGILIFFIFPLFYDTKDPVTYIVLPIIILVLVLLFFYLFIDSFIRGKKLSKEQTRYEAILSSLIKAN